MKCGRIRRRLSAYLDDRVSGGERLTIGLHISRCHACRSRFEELRKLRLTLLADAREPVPAMFSVSWRTRIRAEAQRHRPISRRAWFIGLAAIVPAAACLILIATGVVLFSPNDLNNLDRGGIAIGIVPERGITDSETQADEEPPIDIRDDPSMASPGLLPVPGPSTGSVFGDEGDLLVKSTAPFAGDLSVLVEERASSAEFSKAPETGLGNSDSPGPWRVWVTSLGDNPGVARRILDENDLPSNDIDGTVLELPVLLRGERTHLDAEELSRLLENAGCRTVIEFAPE